MDKKEAINIAKRYVKIVNERFHIEKVLLFGSFAKGTNHSDSDIDLAFVFKSVDDIIDRQIELMIMRTDDDLNIEPHPFRLSDFENSNPVVQEILKYGIELSKA
ncbi:MAG: nucleotidyltransferase domain-containing protein [Melioribacteraceae bacterium]|nr:nucleotidyltransferase domain-containing protein [Melioribacteraceae bacterium]